MADSVHIRNLVNGDQTNQVGNGNIGQVVQAPSVPDRPRQTVLMLTSNPLDTGRLRLDEEYRAIDRAITGARHRDQLDLRLGAAARYGDLQELLLQHEPAVVHYAGHNSAVHGIVLVDERGNACPVQPKQLSDLFAITGRWVSCVVLNACLTKDQAAAIVEHVTCVVGMSRPVLDGVAIDFAAGFYNAIAAGQSVATAFRLGRNRMGPGGGHYRDLAPLPDEDGSSTPVLIDPWRRAESLVIVG